MAGRPRQEIDIDLAKQLYSLGLSTRIIGTALGCHGELVRRRLHEIHATKGFPTQENLYEAWRLVLQKYKGIDINDKSQYS